MKFVWIEPGTFTMGSPASEAGREKHETQNQVTLTKGFYLQTTQVTVGHWRQFIKESNYRSQAEIEGGVLDLDMETYKNYKKEGIYWDNPGFEQTDNHPVTYVSFNDIQAFIEWINQREECTHGLPTEAQWEYACRAGSTGAWCFGNDKSQLEKYAWFSSNANDKTHPVNLKLPNAWGLHDMHGNVLEFCLKEYADYSSMAVADHKVTEEGPVNKSQNKRVLSCKVVNAISRISLAVMLPRGKNKRVVQTHRFCSFSL